ncbi:MAG: metal-dependent hydrolase [Saprospiraceae bacterium]|nr:metal-dependent hydrolase [Saprospiraceae bacterium]
MFIGHFAVGLGAKSLTPKVSLGTLFLSVQLVDLMWPTLLLLGVEHVKIAPGITAVTPLDFVHYPVTHSLLMVLVWGSLFGLVYWSIKKDTRTAIILGSLVLSHWLLDLIVHRPDLPLYPGGDARLGFGLWNSWAGTIITESLLFVAGLYYYLKTTKAKDRIGTYAFWGLAAFMAVTYVANLMGPPPPDETTIAWAGHTQWLLVIWAYWLDRHREAV